MESPEAALEAAAGPDGLSLKRWLAGYVLYLLALLAPVGLMLARRGEDWSDLLLSPRQFFTSPAHDAMKLLLFAFYLSISCTMLPLPTGWIVAALATRDMAVADSLWATVVIVATVGAVGSTIANLHDYHLFTWMLRHRRIARIRQMRFTQRAERWFARRPFALLAVFNVLPIPVDVVRMLAATFRYPLRRFAAANFLGRWVRYAAVAAATFQMGQKGWWMVLALLALAVVLGAMKLIGKALPGK